MNIKKILLTGDDGYDAVGIKLLVHYLKGKYDLFIAGTKIKQSGVGGHLSLKTGGSYGESVVDGVNAFWVDGYPCDAIECLVGRYNTPYDLVISGINWGMNIGGTVVSSGTFSAAVRAVALGIAPKAIVLSWQLPTTEHGGNTNGFVDDYLQYPGKSVYSVCDLAIQNNLWNAELLNINFPQKYSKTIHFTKPLGNTTKFFNYPIPFDTVAKKFMYSSEPEKLDTIKQVEYDTGALLNDIISITPHKVVSCDEEVRLKHKNNEILID